MKKIYPVILAGGVGSRVWPLSRHTMPKQFIILEGQRFSLFQNTVKRSECETLFYPLTVFTHTDFRFIVADQLMELNVQAEIYLEPLRKDSASVIGLAAERIYSKDPDAIIVVFPSDHLIPDSSLLNNSLSAGLNAADNEAIVLIGKKPDSPVESYGYICPEQNGHEQGSTVYTVKQFVEKPSHIEAERLIETGALWNTGIVMAKAKVILDAFTHFDASLPQQFQNILNTAHRDLDFIRLDPDSVSCLPKISFDYAILEHTKNLIVVMYDGTWKDLGTLEAVHHHYIELYNTNSPVIGNSLALESDHVFIYNATQAMTTVIGCKDLIVINTEDATLVLHKSQFNHYKSHVEHLETLQPEVVNQGQRVYRPWGTYQTIDRGHRFQVKRICVKPNGKLSLQKHLHRAEHWVVVKGTAEVTIANIVKQVHENESVNIPIGTVHSLYNPGKIPLELIEVQVGAYTEEDDIIRLEDVYGRLAESSNI